MLTSIHISNKLIMV